SAAEVEQIVRVEAGERERAAHDYERAGHADRAGRLRREAQLLLAGLSDDDRPGRWWTRPGGRARPRPLAAAVSLVPRSRPAGQPDSLGTDPGRRARPRSGAPDRSREAQGDPPR